MILEFPHLRIQIGRYSDIFGFSINGENEKYWFYWINKAEPTKLSHRISGLPCFDFIIVKLFWSNILKKGDTNVTENLCESEYMHRLHSHKSENENWTLHSLCGFYFLFVHFSLMSIAWMETQLKDSFHQLLQMKDKKK